MIVGVGIDHVQTGRMKDILLNGRKRSKTGYLQKKNLNTQSQKEALTCIWLRVFQQKRLSSRPWEKAFLKG